MLVHSLAYKYARFVVLGRLITGPPRSDHWTPPLKSDDLYYGTKRYWTPPFKNPGQAHGPATLSFDTVDILDLLVKFVSYNG